ncbi:MAG: hypothetical protein WC889_08650 [Myxococcota bacterium]
MLFFQAVPILVALSLLPGCSKPAGPPEDTCVKLQQLSARCQAQILEIVREHLKTERAGSADNDAGKQYAMFESRLKKKMQQETARKQCEQFRAAPSGEEKKRYIHMAECNARGDCNAFARCILDL